MASDSPNREFIELVLRLHRQDGTKCVECRRSWPCAEVKRAMPLRSSNLASDDPADAVESGYREVIRATLETMLDFRADLAIEEWERLIRRRARESSGV